MPAKLSLFTPPFNYTVTRSHLDPGDCSDPQVQQQTTPGHRPHEGLKTLGSIFNLSLSKSALSHWTNVTKPCARGANETFVTDSAECDLRICTHVHSAQPLHCSRRFGYIRSYSGKLQHFGVTADERAEKCFLVPHELQNVLTLASGRAPHACACLSLSPWSLTGSNVHAALML